MTVQNASQTSKITRSEKGAREIYDNGNLNLWGEKYQARNNNSRGHSFLSCIICGRDTSKQGNSNGVHVGAGGASIIHPEDIHLERDDAGWMGWFPIGSECIKAIPAEFRAANPYPDKVKGV